MDLIASTILTKPSLLVPSAFRDGGVGVEVLGGAGVPGWGWGYPYGYYGGYGSGYGYGGSSRSRVAELQSRLARAGYYHGAIDGILGPATRRAIRAYGRNHGYVG